MNQILLQIFSLLCFCVSIIQKQVFGLIDWSPWTKGTFPVLDLYFIFFFSKDKPFSIFILLMSHYCQCQLSIWKWRKILKKKNIYLWHSSVVNLYSSWCEISLKCQHENYTKKTLSSHIPVLTVAQSSFCFSNNRKCSFICTSLPSHVQLSTSLSYCTTVNLYKLLYNS